MPRSCVLNYVSVMLLAAATLASGQEEPEEKKLPTTGEEVAQFADVDEFVRKFMHRRKIPGGSLAIVVDGEVKLARGYGYADKEKEEEVQPNSLFRIASISKPITAVAVLKLVDEGKLKLDDKIVDVLKLRGTVPDHDPWWDEVTIAQLLSHTAGFDRNRSGDPMFMDEETVAAFGATLPVTHHQVIEYQYHGSLDYAPGERYAYSNFGYCMLGRAIEQVSGQPYEKYVQEQVFAPLGIASARIGGSLESERAENEVKYYTIDEYEDVAVVGPSIGNGKVLGQYGGWNQPLLDSHGGWIMSAVDLVKFGAALDEVEEGKATRGKLLKIETVREMFTAQTPFSYKAESKFPGYGFGWTITQLDGTPLVEHGGALPCSATTLGRLGDRIWFAVLFNLGKTRSGKWLQSGLDAQIGKRVLEATKEPPKE
jgi:CubicO group peptidase (beta-lactamase class C family)